MAVSVDASASSPSHFNKITSMTMDPPLFSPSSDRKIWNELQNRVDTIVERRKLKDPKGGKPTSMREECLLLIRGFDSVSSSLSQLTSNLDTALQGAKDLSKTSLTELVVHGESKNRESEDGEEMNKPVKRKCHSDQSSEDHQGGVEKKENEQSPKNGKLKRAKNLAVSMATNAASLARELKSLKSDLCFTQERCVLLEEENRRLREGFDKGMRPEEDDLVRLQLEALLAEKSRLANENANLKRENQCLNELVAYHQLTSQDLSENDEEVFQGMCLNFSSPTANEANGDHLDAPHTPRADLCGFSTSLDHCSEE